MIKKQTKNDTTHQNSVFIAIIIFLIIIQFYPISSHTTYSAIQTISVYNSVFTFDTSTVALLFTNSIIASAVLSPLYFSPFDCSFG